MGARATLNIPAALRLAFDNPEYVYGFPSMENRNELFNGHAPLDIMAQGDMISLYVLPPSRNCGSE